MDEEELFQANLENGDPAALQELLDRYRKALLQIIRLQLDNSIRNQSGTEDILSSALASFARRVNRHELNLGNWRMVWGTLLGFVVNKCREAKRRSVRSPTAQPGQFENDHGEVVNWEPIGRGPPPESETDWNDLADALTRDLPDYAPEVLKLLLEGNNINQIATILGLTWYQVNKVVQQMAERIERILRN